MSRGRGRSQQVKQAPALVALSDWERKSWWTLYGIPELVDSFTMAGPTFSVGDSCYAMNSEQRADWRPLERSYAVEAGTEWWVWRLRSEACPHPVGVILTPAGVEEPLAGPWQPDGSFMMEVGQITFSTATDPVSEETYRRRKALPRDQDPEGFIGVSDEVIVANLGGDYCPHVNARLDSSGALSALAVMTCAISDALDAVISGHYPIRPEDIATRLGVSVESVETLLAEDAASAVGSYTKRNGYVGPRRWTRPVPPA